MRYVALWSLIFVLAGCMSTSTYYPKMEGAEVEQERQNQIAYVKNNGKAATGAALNANHKERLQRVAVRIADGGLQLCSRMGKPAAKCRFNFGLTDGKAVNAYADGKTIFVNPAMIDFAGTDEELAVVLGHEYAHNVMGHITAKQTNAMMGNVFGAMADALAASQGIGTGSSFSKIGASVGAGSYSKDFEKEADYVGLYITVLAGYDINNAPEFWRRMSLQDSRAIYNGVTHPSNPERYIALGKTIREIKRKQESGEVLVPNIKVE